MRASYAQQENGLSPLLQRKSSSFPSVPQARSRLSPPTVRSPGGHATEMPLYRAMPPRTPGARLGAGSPLQQEQSFSSTGSRRKPCSSLPGSPPTQIIALMESAEFPRRPRGMERFIVGSFVSLQYRSCTDAVCSPPMARKLCTWASSQHTEDLCFSRSFINLTTYGSICRAPPPPPPGCRGWTGALPGCPVPLRPGFWAPCSGETPKEKKHTALWGWVEG